MFFLLWWFPPFADAADAGGGPVIGPTPDVGGGFGRRRTAMFVRKNADWINRQVAR